MDCREVKNLLSEYIDNVLAEDTAALVRDHLDACASCTRTYESMTRLIGYMKSMETVDEPEGFLEEVKAGLEKRFSWANLFRRLYSPPLVKIPLELAVVALILVVVVRMPGIGGGPELYEITFAFDSRKDVPVVEKAEPERIKLEGQALDLSITSTEVAATEKREKRGPEEAEGKASSAVPKKAAPAPAERKLDSDESLQEEELSPASDSDAIIEIPEQRSYPMGALGKGGKKGGDEEEPLRGVIRSIGGKIIEFEYDEGRTRLIALTVEIPAERYHVFLHELDKLGDVGIDIPVPADVLDREGAVVVKMHLH
jgi:hypothetical protein